MTADWRLQVALALINALQIIMLAIINRRGVRTEEKLNGHITTHVQEAIARERTQHG